MHKKTYTCFLVYEKIYIRVFWYMKKFVYVFSSIYMKNNRNKRQKYVYVFSRIPMHGVYLFSSIKNLRILGFFLAFFYFYFFVPMLIAIYTRKQVYEETKNTYTITYETNPGQIDPGWFRF